MVRSRNLSGCVFAATFLLLNVTFALTALAGIDPVNKGEDGEAIHGYDAVAYFTEGRSVRGDEEFSYEWMGATWHFSNETNRALFIEEPDKYVPKYGGYCAYAVGNNYTANGDPTAWCIVDGKLYLNYNKNVREMWLKDRSDLIKKGDANWPTLLKK